MKKKMYFTVEHKIETPEKLKYKIVYIHEMTSNPYFSMNTTKIYAHIQTMNKTCIASIRIYFHTRDEYKDV